MIPVILSGGSGTRLWPVSRESYPKQFCEFFDRSFLANTVERILPLGTPYIVTLESMLDLTRSAVSSFGISDDQIITEPMGKNTGAAIALMCHLLEIQGKENEIVGVFPSDHLIARPELFRLAVSLAERVAREKYLAVIGITPKYPATGFGYIEIDGTQLFSDNSSPFHAVGVRAFHEKPSSELAEKFINSHQYYWNAGMFVFQVRHMIDLFKNHLPEHWDRIRKINKDRSNLRHVYANLESISIDYGIVEKVKEIACVPCEIGWSDVGTWDEVARLSEEEQDLRLDSKAKIYNVGTPGRNFVFSPTQKVIGVVGISDALIVDTPDALLVASRGESEKVKILVQELKRAKVSQALDHRFDTRPWGTYEVLHEASEFKLKKISVLPGAQLSYQSHAKRSETWVIIEGKAEVTLDDKVKVLSPGEVIQIPAHSKHRIRNPGQSPLVFIEVQTGAYFGEDDIVRHQDDYGRA